jgi:phosphoribosylformylglycinamidine synthase I
MRPAVLVLHVPGTNRDHDAAEAIALAGGAPEIVQLEQLIAGQRQLDEFRMLLLPGGFSYGDDLGAGRVWSIALRHQLRDQMNDFVASGRPVLGICNGFQALIKSGLIPAGPSIETVWADERPATLTHNASGHFECRWVRLEPNAQSQCVFTRDLREPIVCPVAHGEGRVAVRSGESLEILEAAGQVTLRYAGESDGAAGYPYNPNGSVGDIAALCNPAGNVMGMMPHPEDHIRATQHPEFHRGVSGNLGLALFESGVRYAARV